MSIARRAIANLVDDDAAIRVTGRARTAYHLGRPRRSAHRSCPVKPSSARSSTGSPTTTSTALGSDLPHERFCGEDVSSVVVNVERFEADEREPMSARGICATYIRNSDSLAYVDDHGNGDRIDIIRCIAVDDSARWRLRWRLRRRRKRTSSSTTPLRVDMFAEREATHRSISSVLTWRNGRCPMIRPQPLRVQPALNVPT